VRRLRDELTATGTPAGATPVEIRDRPDSAGDAKMSTSSSGSSSGRVKLDEVELTAELEGPARETTKRAKKLDREPTPDPGRWRT